MIEVVEKNLLIIVIVTAASISFAIFPMHGLTLCFKNTEVINNTAEGI